MADIGAYLNVYNTTLVILDRKGWSLEFEKEREWWHAKKAQWHFLADDPIQLLGLVAIHEYHNPTEKTEYWWKIDSPDILSRLDPRTE
jgi:hypothetical protein